MKRSRLASRILVLAVGAAGSFLICSPAGADGDPGREIRIERFPIALQCWTFRNFTFVETLSKVRDLGVKYIQAYPGQPLGGEAPGAVFDQNMTNEQLDLVRKKLQETGIELSGYGVVNFENTEKDIRGVFDFARKLDIPVIITEPKEENAALLEKLVLEYGLRIAIHNHPEPSRFAKPETVLSYVRDKDERFGSCFDNGHFMRGGHKPLECLRAFKGRVWDVHLKDRSAFGTRHVKDVPLGQGQAAVRSILAELTLQDYLGWLTIEHEAEADVKDPVPAVKKCVDYIRSVTYYQDYRELLTRHLDGFEKNGWNHYGPGHFELDPETGVLTSQGGMGLLWYSVRKYRDFVLELDFKCSKRETNSGVFLRVPDVPTSDDYIYHSFEIQINDAGEGSHKTAAVYDAEPVAADAGKPTGEWNHMKITYQSRRLEVELNSQRIVDWQSEPRGKVKDIAPEGYIGLQNHDWDSSVYFRGIFIKELR